MNQTLADIRVELKSRAMEVEVVKRKTDQAVRRQQVAGCWSAIWAIFTRRRDSSYTAGASAEASCAAESSAGTSTSTAAPAHGAGTSRGQTGTLS